MFSREDEEIRMINLQGQLTKINGVFIKTMETYLLATTYKNILTIRKGKFEGKYHIWLAKAAPRTCR